MEAPCDSCSAAPTTRWDYATGLTGTEGVLESLAGGFYAMNLGGGTGVQTITPVPEPATLMLAASGLLALAARRRRCRKTSAIP
jgi:MYXO-CTERM domain-containing protein